MEYRIEITKRISSSLLMAAAAALLVVATPMGVMADQYDDQIKNLNTKVEGYRQEAGRLSTQADTLSNKIATLNTQKQTIQSQIQLNQAKHNQLVGDIAANEARLQKQKSFLGKTLATMYVDGDVSDLEMIASSKSVGDFLDKHEYRNAVRSQIQNSIDKVKDLKIELEQQQVDVKHVLADQQSQRQALAAQEAEQQRLLEETKGQEAAYQNLVVGRTAEIADLRAQQVAANERALRQIREAEAKSRATASSGAKSNPASKAVIGSAPVASGAKNGGYPAKWANAPKDALVDSWGMYTRECVSYTAFKVAQSGKYMPYWGGRGNANQWPSSAATDGIPTGYAPKPGSIAISMAGPYGHAMYVERVNGDGTIFVSQYNYSWDGNYSEMTISGAGLIYIYF